MVERHAFSPLGENPMIEYDMVISIHPTVHTPLAWHLSDNLNFYFTTQGIVRLPKTPNEVFVVT